MRRERLFPEDRAIALRPGLWGGRHIRGGVDGYLVFDPLTQRQEFIEGAQAQVLSRLGLGLRASSLPPELMSAARELWRRGWLSLSHQEGAERLAETTNKKGSEARSEEWNDIPRAMEGATFTCGGCGLCCRGFHDIGPVTERERERVISAASVIERTRHRAANELVQLALPSHPSEYWPYQLATQRGRCVFLSGESRCSIHEAVGGAEKPLVCRVFPLQLSVVGGRSRMIASSRCPSVALEEGAPLSGEGAAMLRGEGAPVLQASEPECGWAAYLEAEGELLASLGSEASEPREARRTAFSALVARVGGALAEPVEVGRLYATARRLEQESRQKGGEPLAAVSWGMRWALHQRSKSPARPWQEAFTRGRAVRGAGEVLRRYLAAQVYSGELLQHRSLAEGAWRLLQRSLLIEGHARALVQAGLAKEPHATAEAIYLWDFATMTEAWQFLSP